MVYIPWIFTPSHFVYSQLAGKGLAEKWNMWPQECQVYFNKLEETFIHQVKYPRFRSMGPGLWYRNRFYIEHTSFVKCAWCRRRKIHISVKLTWTHGFIPTFKEGTESVPGQEEGSTGKYQHEGIMEFSRAQSEGTPQTKCWYFRVLPDSS